MTVQELINELEKFPKDSTVLYFYEEDVHQTGNINFDGTYTIINLVL